MVLGCLFPMWVAAQGSHTVSGTVVTDTGAAIVGATVTAHTDGDFNQPAAMTTTDGGGHYQLEVETGSYAIAVEPDRAGWYPFTAYPNIHCLTDTWHVFEVNADVEEVDFAIARGGKLDVTFVEAEGNVVDFGLVPYFNYFDEQGGEIGWHSFGAIEDGHYLSPPLPVGAVILGVSPLDRPDYLHQYYCGVYRAGEADPIAITGDAVTDLGNCELTPVALDFHISGRVTGAEDTPLQGVTVWAESVNGYRFEGATGSDGRYEILVDASEYKVQAIPDPASLYAGMSYPGRVCFANADWLEGGVDHDDIDFELPFGGRFRLRLAHQDGSLPGIPIDVMFDAFEPGDWSFACSSLWIRTDENGDVVSPVLPPAPYWVLIGDNTSEEFLDHYLYQGYCGYLMFNVTPAVVLESGEFRDLGTCELIPSSLRPLSPRSGSLFSFDPDWLEVRSALMPSGTGGTAAGDLNNDGLVDLAAVIYDANIPPPTPNERIAVMINQGGNRFLDSRDEWVPLEYFGNPVDVLFRDFDCDGYQDLVMGCWAEWVPDDMNTWGEQDKIWRNIDGQYFEEFTESWMFLDDPSKYGLPNPAFATHALDVSDVDNDGDFDIVRGSGYEPVLLNDGAGSMSLAPDSTNVYGEQCQWLFPNYGGSGLATGDLNLDGFADAFFVGAEYWNFAGTETFHTIAMGTGTGALVAVPTEQAPLDTNDGNVEGYGALITDFNEDGLPEIYIANVIGLGEPGAEFLRREGKLDQLLTVTGVTEGIPVFEDISGNLDQHSGHLNRTTGVVGADIDNDGRQDILVSSPSGANDDHLHPEIRILINRGELQFEEMARETLPEMFASIGAISVLDSDNDGDWDLFLGNGYPYMILLINELLEKHDLNGDGYVTLSDAHLVLNDLATVAPGSRQDLNQDGAIDARDLSLVLRYQTTTRADNSTLVPACSPEDGE